MMVSEGHFPYHNKMLPGKTVAYGKKFPKPLIIPAQAGTGNKYWKKRASYSRSGGVVQRTGPNNTPPLQ
jgi:hypothetical protein